MKKEKKVNVVISERIDSEGFATTYVRLTYKRKTTNFSIGNDIQKVTDLPDLYINDLEEDIISFIRYNEEIDENFEIVGIKPILLNSLTRIEWSFSQNVMNEIYLDLGTYISLNNYLKLFQHYFSQLHYNYSDNKRPSILDNLKRLSKSDFQRLISNLPAKSKLLIILDKIINDHCNGKNIRYLDWIRNIHDVTEEATEKYLSNYKKILASINDDANSYPNDFKTIYTHIDDLLIGGQIVELSPIYCTNLYLWTT